MGNTSFYSSIGVTSNDVNAIEDSKNAAAASATAAATSATSSATSASEAEAAKVAAEAAQVGADASETNAAASAAAAASSLASLQNSEVNAAASAATAASEANSASSSATNASNSEVSAAASAASAATDAAAAATSLANIGTSEANAAASATASASSAASASTDAAAASASQVAAAASESAAATSATNSATSAAASLASEQAAATSEANSANSASSSATSATTATNAKTAAESARDSALAALDSFDDRYLGVKSSDPTTDNDGNALVAGSLYYNDTDNVMKVYEGSSWVAAYASLSGAMLQSNNLSDVDNVAAARTNLGLVIGTDVQAYSAVLAGTTASYTTAEETKLAGVESGADVTDAANVEPLVDAHLNTSTATSGEYLSWNGADYDWASVPAGYADSDVDTHLNSGSASSGQYLGWNGTDYAWSTVDLTTKVSKSGDTMTGALILNADPTAALGASTKQYVDTQVAGIVDSAPATLDTLNELAAALGDDPNFATTVTNSIGTKMPLAGGTFTGDVTFSGGQSAITLTSGSDIRATTGAWTGEHSGKLQYHDSDWYIQFADKMIGRNGSGVNVFTVDSSGDGYFSNSVQIAGGTAWHSGNDGSGSGLDADTLDGVQGSNFLRSDQYDEATGDIVFSGGAGAVTIGASSDIRGSGGGSWTGESAGKMQYYSNNWYIQYATNFFARDGNGNNRLTVDGSGNLTAHGNVTAFSDIKLKKDIVTIENALDKINAMRGVYYTEIETDRARTGVIAQEVEKVLPEVVLEIEDYNPETGETDTTKSVDYGNMVGLLIEAIKEQQAQIDELKAKLEG